MPVMGIGTMRNGLCRCTKACPNLGCLRKAANPGGGLPVNVNLRDKEAVEDFPSKKQTTCGDVLVEEQRATKIDEKVSELEILGLVETKDTVPATKSTSQASVQTESLQKAAPGQNKGEFLRTKYYQGFHLGRYDQKWFNVELGVEEKK